MKNAWRWIRERTDYSGTRWFVLSVLLVLGLAATLSPLFWGELSGSDSQNPDSIGSTIRNVILIVGAVLALPLAVWRGKVAENQVKATQESVNAAHQAIANQRFQAAADMLGHDLNAVRLGAIKTLITLSGEAPSRFYVDAATLLTEFVRNPPGHDAVDVAQNYGGRGYNIREDVMAILQFIGSRSNDEIELEQTLDYRMDLNNAKLQGLVLEGSNFSRVIFAGAYFTNSNLRSVNFSSADLSSCRFQGTFWADACLRGAALSGSNFTGWSFDEAGSYRQRQQDYDALIAKGLVQRQLDEARDDQNNPPRLRDVRDASTGEPLSWHGIAPEDL